MYQFVAIISAIIRYYLPNPYLSWITNQVYADLFNIIVGGLILHVLAYVMTGMVYEKNSAPVLGSFLYLVNYCLIIGLIVLVTWLINIFWIAIIVFIVLYTFVLVLLNRISDKKYNF